MKANKCTIACLIALGAILSGCATTKVETFSLKDTLISIKEQAKEAGASKVTYEASVVSSSENAVSLVVPTGFAESTFSFGKKKEIGSKVTVELNLQTPTETKSPPEKKSGKKYLLDLETFKALELQ